MGQDRDSRFEDRLKNYSSIARSTATPATLRQRAANWRVYAAVTGSAMAMATNASAGVIYSGIQNLTASISSVGTPGEASTMHHASVKIVNLTANGAGFQILVEQARSGGFVSGLAAVQGFNSLQFLDQSHHQLEKLNFGANVTAQTGRASAVGFLKTVLKTVSHSFGKGVWQPSQTGFAAFAFYTNTTLTAQLDFGWLRLVFSDSAINGAPDSITAVDWAYDNSGGTILAGQTSTAPEPSTSGLALLATGALGVAALRRRRKAAV